MKVITDKSVFWTIMLDVSFQLIAVLLLLASNYKQSWNEASKVADLVPELRNKNRGLQGQLDDADQQLANYASEGKRQQGIVNSLRKDLGVLGEQLGEQREELDRLRPAGPVDLVILVDCTGSLKPHHEQLKQAMMSLFKWTPRLSSQCRIGVLGFRDAVVYRYPLTTIRPPSKDDSQAKLIKFLTQMKTEGAPANHAPAFREALEMLPDIQGRRQVLVCLGDIGPSELDGRIGYSSTEVQAAMSITQRVKSWAAKGNRSVGSIFVGVNDTDSADRQWFQSLAQPTVANFGSDSVDMFNVIFRSIEKE